MAHKGRDHQLQFASNLLASPPFLAPIDHLGAGKGTPRVGMEVELTGAGIIYDRARAGEPRADLLSGIIFTVMMTTGTWITVRDRRSSDLLTAVTHLPFDFAANLRIGVGVNAAGWVGCIALTG